LNSIVLSISSHWNIQFIKVPILKYLRNNGRHDNTCNSSVNFQVPKQTQNRVEI
jgi:hypothetical protein